MRDASGGSELEIPKPHQGSYYPEWLMEPRRPAEEALGLSALDKSKVSRMKRSLDDEVDAFQKRPLDKGCSYVWLDALCP